MKKFLALLLTVVMVLTMVACGEGKKKADGQVVIGTSTEASGDWAYSAFVRNPNATDNSVMKLTDDMSTIESNQHGDYVINKTVVKSYERIEEENGNPSADVWFGGTTDPYNMCAAEGLLEPYAAQNASHLLSDMYKDKDGQWYGIYKGILGFMVNTDELARMNLEAPADWQDLLKPEYKGLIWLSNYNTAGTAKLVINTMIQKYGHDEGIQYLVDLDKNIEVYTKSGSGPSKNVGTGECVIGIGFLHDGITQIVDNGYTNVELIIPSYRLFMRITRYAVLKRSSPVSAPPAFRAFMTSSM